MDSFLPNSSACAQNQDAADKLVFLALDEINNGRPDLALKNLEAIKKDRPIRDRYLLSAVSTLATGDAEKALFYADAELIWFPTSIAALNLRGEIAQLVKPKPSINSKDTAKDLSCFALNDLITKATEFLLAGEAKKALPYLEQANLIAPGSENLNLLRARALFGSDRPWEADLALEAELDLYPENLEAKQLLGERINQTFNYINDLDQPDCLMFSKSMLAGLGLNRSNNRFILEIAIEQSASAEYQEFVFFGDNVEQLLGPLQKIVSHFSNFPKKVIVNPSCQELEGSSALGLIYFGEGANRYIEANQISRLVTAKLLAGGIVIINKAIAQIGFIQDLRDTPKQNDRHYYWDETEEYKWFQKP